MVNNINEVSNPTQVKANFRKYKGNDDVKLELSEKKDKKYKVIIDNKTVHFGSTMPDYTKHKDESRRKSYLARQMPPSSSLFFLLCFLPCLSFLP